MTPVARKGCKQSSLLQQMIIVLNYFAETLRGLFGTISLLCGIVFSAGLDWFSVDSRDDISLWLTLHQSQNVKQTSTEILLGSDEKTYI
jgi:hypothetical protein